MSLQKKRDVIVHFEVKEASTTNILIDMTADFVAISHSHNLRPVLKATIESSEATVPPPSTSVQTLRQVKTQERRRNNKQKASGECTSLKGSLLSPKDSIFFKTN